MPLQYTLAVQALVHCSIVPRNEAVFCGPSKEGTNFTSNYFLCVSSSKVAQKLVRITFD